MLNLKRLSFQSTKKLQIHLLEEFTIKLKSMFWKSLTLNFTGNKLTY